MEKERLTFAGHDKSIDDNLGAVEEVAELRFPDAKAARALDAHAVLEAENRFFRQKIVRNLHYSQNFLSVTEIF